MKVDGTRKTDVAHWDQAWGTRPRARLPKAALAVTKNIHDVLRRYVRPGQAVIEIGCAPGKHLAWCARVLGGRVSGLDYSPVGFGTTQWLFAKLGIAADLRMEDVFKTTFPNEAFDVVYSFGVIEHFDDPTHIVRKHLELVRPGGWVVIAVPNYGGVYGRIQRRIDPENLAIHNLRIMSLDALRQMAPPDLAEVIEVSSTGRPSPSLLSLAKLIGRRAGKLVTIVGELVCRLSPVSPAGLRPLLVLAIQRRPTAC